MLKYKSKLVFVYIILSLAYIGTIYCQSFQISEGPAEYYSIDKFANEVYYFDFLSNKVYAYRLKDTSIYLTTFWSLPIFANTSHKCAFAKYDKVKIYDFESGKNFLIMDSLENNFVLTYSFSPSDKYLFFKNYFYSFADSTIHETNVVPFGDQEAEWVSDSIIIFTDQYNQNVIYQFDLTTELVDTLLLFDEYQTIASYSFNRNQNLLYYSLEDLEYPKIHVYDPSTQIDSIVFDTEIDDSNNTCWNTPISLRSMGWSPDFQRLAFFGFLLTNSGAGIYTIDANSNLFKTYEDCGYYGLKYNLKWIDENTIAFANLTYGHVYGYLLDKFSNIEMQDDSTSNEIIKISVYPNPFNNLINIKIDGEIRAPEINIYDILGEKVFSFNNVETIGSNYYLTWYGQDNFGRAVSSGVYFIMVTDKLHPFILKGKNKIIYLK